MKNLVFFIFILCIYFSITYLDKTYISTDSKIFDFLAKDYPSSVVQNYMESQKKWWWVSYAITPVLIGLKVLLVAFCLNFLKLLDIEGIEKIKFSDFLFLTLLAELIFTISGFYKFFNFYWLQTDYKLQDLQTYYPLSLLNFREQISTEKWMAYPLQVANLFEIAYWIVLAVGIRELFVEKISYLKSFSLVALTYGIGLLFWVGVVCFMILNASY